MMEASKDEPSGRDNVVISTDKERLQEAFIIAQLKETYWAHNRSPQDIVKSLETSLCFGAYRGDRQVGFARVVTDDVTFAWVCDVVVDADVRGRGVGKKIIEAIVDRVKVKRLVLKTNDAHGLYARFGFQPLDDDAPRWMVRLGLQ